MKRIKCRDDLEDRFQWWQYAAGTLTLCTRVFKLRAHTYKKPIGHHGVVLALRVVAVFDVIRRYISRHRSVDLAQDLWPQFLWRRGFDRFDDPVHLQPHVQHAGAAGAGFNQGLQPTRRDHACAHVDLGVRIHQCLVALHHDNFIEGHRGDRGRDSVDEVDAVLLGPALKDLAVGGLCDVLHGEMPCEVCATVGLGRVHPITCHLSC
jgi:hypothetical protein